MCSCVEVAVLMCDKVVLVSQLSSVVDSLSAILLAFQHQRRGTTSGRKATSGWSCVWYYCYTR